MIVYIETNFVLELALVQEQNEYCQKIMALCEDGRIKLMLPVFCVAESYETLVRREKKRTQVADELRVELRQLSRSDPYKHEIDTFQSIIGLLARSSQEEDRRLVTTLERVLRITDVVSLDADIILDAAHYRVEYKLGPQDSIIYASVLRHRAATMKIESCFINRNTHDFDDADIVESLTNNNCKMLFRFEDGFNYIQHRIDATGSD